MPHGDLNRFSLHGRVIIITGAAGLLGRQHASTVAEAGGVPVLLDVDAPRLAACAATLAQDYGVQAPYFTADITNRADLEAVLAQVVARCGRLDGLINNAANNPKMEGGGSTGWLRFENLPLEIWQQDLAVGLTGAFLCAQVFGAHMARAGRGVIVNIASDLSLIAPDQRIYEQPGLPPEAQPVKSVTYSVVKTGLVGLTRYLATYWAKSGVRVNAISPGGVANGQPEEFVAKLTALIPMGRMAAADEYRCAIRFLLSDASSYMTGTNLVLDGGRTVW